MNSDQIITLDSLTDAISYVFRQEQTSMLSLDRICEVLQQPNLYLNSKTLGSVQCSTISRRRISSVLSSSDFFVRAGPPRTCFWAIRPHNPLFLSNGSISASIEQMLTTNGPMTLEQFVEFTELNGADIKLFEKFLDEHKKEFSLLDNGTYWFTGQTPPVPKNYDNISSALVDAFSSFPLGASVEELHWYLCLSTVGGTKKISRRNVSRELSRRTDLFEHLSRARYTLASQHINRQRPHSLPTGFKVPNSFQDPSAFEVPILVQNKLPPNQCPLIEHPYTYLGPFQLQQTPQRQRVDPFPIPNIRQPSVFPIPENVFQPQEIPPEDDEFDPVSFFENTRGFEFTFD
ncbi:hypothetical protein GPJ56_002515 [Histomonas meleagridis]|uniref:uncharacterized protein n=1 Tax=Histomonas meleagridis TaxID=135588 RepID=UPI00355AB8B9|nr:hypothetical protein GPJ56_002515 [Histomonas meleagridis]KAH0806022.1 hypothetical protein GO595_001183 [Histomonas meleagridis]